MSETYNDSERYNRYEQQDAAGTGALSQNANVSADEEHRLRAARRAARVERAMSASAYASMKNEIADDVLKRYDESSQPAAVELNVQPEAEVPHVESVQAMPSPVVPQVEKRAANAPSTQVSAEDLSKYARSEYPRRAAAQRAATRSASEDLASANRASANRPSANRASAQTSKTTKSSIRRATGTTVVPVKTESAKKKRNVWTYVFYGALIVCVGSLIALGVMWFSYFQGQQKYSRIADDAIETSDIAQKELKELSVDWDSLLAVNGDTVAWIYMPDTVINYPIVQAADNDYYLTRDFDGDQGWLANYGTVFLDYRNSPDFSDTVSFVYGHNMNDGSMFAFLTNLADQATFNKNRTLYLLTPERNYKLSTVAMMHVSAYDAIVVNSFSSSDERIEYMEDKLNRAVARASDAPSAEDMDHIVVLATCDDSYASSGRYLLYCIVDEEAAVDLSGTIGFNTSSQEGIVDSVGVAS